MSKKHALTWGLYKSVFSILFLISSFCISESKSSVLSFLSKNEKRWHEYEGRENRLFPIGIKSLVDNSNGLEITCVDRAGKEIVIFFGGEIYTYRFISEVCHLDTLQSLLNDSSQCFVYVPSLYKLSDSAYLNWFKEQSIDENDAKEFDHYVIYTTYCTIEVISPYEPTIAINDIKR